MKTRLSQKIRALATACALAAAFSSASARAALKVVTLLPMQADLVTRVAGDLVTVASLIPPGGDPHAPEPDSRMRAALKEADLLVRNGAGLERGWLKALLAEASNPRIQPGEPGDLDLASRVKLKRAGENPHYLLDPRNAVDAALAIADRLVALDPAHKARYETGAEQLAAKLRTAAADWEKRLKPLEGALVVAYHDAWPYLTDWLGLKTFAVIESAIGVPPTPEQLVDLERRAKTAGARLVLIEEERPRNVAALVARRSGATLVALPSEVSPSLAKEGYLGAFEKLASRLESVARASAPTSESAPSPSPSPTASAAPGSG